ncbi:MULTISPECIES: FomB family phosphonate monophosphate kinase [unclassified Streptomyces]|uniref:FomB family phosphonate monophosphate kinase n=1 Tax=unclassified Streptomyces TaxID=2593676 RepID=UPI0037A0B400
MEALPVRSARTVDLNLLTVRIASNLETFGAYDYFSREASADAVPDYAVHCVDLARDAFDESELTRLADRSLRAQRFRSGYYLSHIFGSPAHLLTRGNSSYVFGRRLERTVWPYFVKRILTDFAVDHGYLHLKAAGFVQDGGATLLVGPNGGGKTVFLSQACLDGAGFLTNTHTLVKEGMAHAVPTAVRVRRDSATAQLIDRHRLRAHLESGDHLAPADLLFPGPRVDSAPVRNIVIADHDPDRRRGIEEVSPPVMEAFLGQFALAVTTYGLKDDLMVHHGGDIGAFTGALLQMQRQLTGLVCSSRCFRVNVDMRDPRSRAAVLKEIAAG